jgi:hypothetical protein
MYNRRHSIDSVYSSHNNSPRIAEPLSLSPIDYIGPQGPIGPRGPIGIISIANFYSLMPPDNNKKINIGEPIDFASDGPSNNNNISRLTSSLFNLTSIGLYEISFIVNINESAQLIIVLNDIELDYTVVGRTNVSSQIIGNCLISTTIANSIISINNPISNNKSITLTSYAGGNNAISSQLTIKQYI